MQTFENQFLIAMPSLDDPYFSRSLTYICEHNEDGAMGIVINQPVGMTLKELLEQTEQDAIVLPEKAETPVLAGGPVSRDRGFILHTTQSGWSSSLQLTSDIMVTTSKDILSALGNNNAPDKAIVALGYAGWSGGQLEHEIQHNSWLTVEADLDILFNTPVTEKWEKAVKKLGIDIWQLGPEAGHA
ncbi:YqgE/AlgH family protein [Aestuariibacter salexigens]|uniref:YqgE/AlgH family protein n=1 Tax=Aestuariibacter salexigens TaxID=226010 RepID=UPI00040BAF48|nr:YqgE/AlgH family protein [Aestuariibacter salexigens]